MRLNLEQLGSIHDLVNDTRWSGAELAREALRRATILRPLAGDGSKMFVITHANTPSFFADLFAVWEIGGCAVCVNAGLTGAELKNVVGFVGAKAVLVAQDTSVNSEVPVICTAQESATPATETAYSGTLDDPALILFTSGTTGDPKGVVHSFRSIFSRLALNQAQLDSRTLARSLCVLPTHFGHGLIGNCLTPLLSGCDLHLMHGAGVAGTARLGAVLDQHQITFMSSVPSFWKMALKLSTEPTANSLQRISIGSAPLSADLWQDVMRWANTDQVANMYGITETANWIGGALASDYQPEDGLLGTCWGGHYAIKEKDGRPSITGEGEIMLQVPSLMNGYFQRQDLTDEILVNGWYLTGDTGSIDERGVLRMTGRNKYAINRAGIKIYPEELDLLLERHPEVEEACAFGVADPVSGEAVAAAVSLATGANSSEQSLLDWLREQIRPEAVPGRIYLVDNIPKTDRGKLNRANVAKFCLSAGDASS